MAAEGREYAALLHRWLHPAVAEEIADALRQAQINSLTTQVPLLLAVAGLNTGILMATCVHAGLPFASYGWMSLLILYTLLRGGYLRRQFARVETREQQDQLIRSTSRAAIGMLAFLGLAAGASYATDLFAQSLLIPMSLGFGSIAIAHCLYRLRAVAMGALGLGIVPAALTLLVAGDFAAQMLAISMISVALLMMRFIAAQYDQLIDNLHLQHSILTLANSDPLTGLANRRAVNVFLDQQASLAGVGLALIDLNDFKQVNDRHGHDVGDALLQHVAKRLQAGFAGPGLVGRLGGDEFVAIFTAIPSKTSLAIATQRLLMELAHPAEIGPLSVPVAASAGYALGTLDHDIAALMKDADDALYAAKRLKQVGKNPFIAAA